jgi:hypothetical protein
MPALQTISGSGEERIFFAMYAAQFRRNGHRDADRISEQ